jgi:sugar phosphate isomerase/epimerase
LPGNTRPLKPQSSIVADRLLSLAAGTVLDRRPEEAVEIAAAAGFGAAGIWYDPESWSTARARAVARRLAATGLTALDIEPVILGRAIDPGEAVVDAAADIGARHVLVAGGPAEPAAVVDRFGALCDRAMAAGTVVVLEFLPIFAVGSLAAAVRVVEEAARPNGAVLVDTLHLTRSGGHPSDLRRVPRRLLPYLQIADAPREAPTSVEGLREEALHERLLPGDGALPLAQALEEVPEVPLSFELRSNALLTTYPDPLDRARVVLAAARRLLGTPDGPSLPDWELEV